MMQQLRNLPIGTEFRSGGFYGKLVDLNDCEATVDTENGPRQRWAPGTEVEPILQQLTLSLKAAPEVVLSCDKMARQDVPQPQEAPKPTPASKKPPRAKKSHDKPVRKDTKTVNPIGNDVTALKSRKKAKAGTASNGKKTGPITSFINDPKPKKGKPKIVGLPATAVLRWMGSRSWSTLEAEAVLKKLKIVLSRNTIVSQISSGKAGLTRESGGFQGDVPTLTRKQTTELKQLRKETKS